VRHGLSGTRRAPPLPRARHVTSGLARGGTRTANHRLVVWESMEIKKKNSVWKAKPDSLHYSSNEVYQCQ
jgi:hypothetical protein